MKKKKKTWFSITAKDCDFQEYRGTGGGGQKKNKTFNAMRCTHKPSGAVGCCEDHREQKANKKEAFKRMAESKDFKVWLQIKIDAGLGKVTIEEADKTGKVVERKLRLDEV